MTRSLLLFAGLLLLLAIKGDGRFPLPEATPDPVFQVYVLAITLLFGAGLVFLLGRARRRQDASEAPPLRLAAALTALFGVLDGGVLWLEAMRYASFGYIWRPDAAVLICLLPASLCAWLAIRRRPVKPALLLGLAAAAHGALILYACACFPLAAARSDMLPLLVQSGHHLLAGHDPYALYHLTAGTSLPLTYLPGLLLAYVPAAVTSCDSRLVGLIYTLGATLLLYRRADSSVAAFLSPFLVNPYLIYRHDVYLAPFWLLLAISWVVLIRPRPARIAAGCGALVATSQLLILPAAAMAIFGFKRFGRQAMVRGAVAAAAACAALCAAFLLADAASFVQGTIGHWQGALNVETIGLTWWLLRVFSAPVIRALQWAAAIAALSIPRPRTSAAVVAAAALALFAFAALNTVIWTYFYLPVLFLAMLSHLQAPQSATSPLSSPPSSPAS